MFDIHHWPDLNVNAHANISALFHFVHNALAVKCLKFIIAATAILSWRSCQCFLTLCVPTAVLSDEIKYWILKWICMCIVILSVAWALTSLLCCLAVGKSTNTHNLCTVVPCSATQEIELFRMWLLSLFSKPWQLCQSCVGFRPGSNWPIPALSLLVKASPVWLDKPCLGCFPLRPSSLGKHCLQCVWGEPYSI